MPDGCAYDNLFGINLSFGIFSLVICVTSVLWIKSTYYEAIHAVDQALGHTEGTQESTDAKSVANSTSDTSTSIPENEKIIASKCDQILTQLNHVGAQATLASAFVWYVCFHDV